MCTAGFEIIALSTEGGAFPILRLANPSYVIATATNSQDVQIVKKGRSPYAARVSA